MALIAYGSGLLLWPLRRWLTRKQKTQGRAPAFIFFAQLAAYIVVACLSCFVQLEHFYYWFIFLVMLNIVFTLAGIAAWICEALHESRKA